METQLERLRAEFESVRARNGPELESVAIRLAKLEIRLHPSDSALRLAFNLMESAAHICYDDSSAVRTQHGMPPLAVPVALRPAPVRTPSPVPPPPPPQRFGGTGADGAGMGRQTPPPTPPPAHGAGPAFEWRETTRFPHPLWEHSAVATKSGGIFVLGGSRALSEQGAGAGAGAGGAASLLATHYHIDPASGQLSTLTPMLEARSRFAALARDGLVYVTGGCDPHRQDLCSTAFEEYDPAARTWKRLRPMPTPRHSHACFLLDGFIYCAGGIGPGGEPLSSVERYDYETKMWAVAPPLTQARSHFACAVLQGRAYAIGGVCRNSRTSSPVELWGTSMRPSVECLQSDGRAWEVMPVAYNCPRACHAATVDGDSIVVAGGVEPSGFPTASTVRLRPSSTGVQKWWMDAPLPTARAYLSAASTPQGMFFVGGGDPMHPAGDATALRLGERLLNARE